MVLAFMVQSAVRVRGHQWCRTLAALAGCYNFSLPEWVGRCEGFRVWFENKARRPLKNEKEVNRTKHEHVV